MKLPILLLTIATLAPLHAAETAALRPKAGALPIPNELIDYPAYLRIAREVQPLQERRRLTEAQFATMAAEPGTVLLDARSADKFKLRHIRGAVSLPFTDFTAESLAKVLPKKRRACSSTATTTSAARRSRSRRNPRPLR